MYGFPFEEDIAGFSEFISKARKIINISASCSPFVPKPHTPFQWDGMKSKTKLKALFNGIRSFVNSLKIKDFGGEDKKLPCSGSFEQVWQGSISCCYGW